MLIVDQVFHCRATMLKDDGINKAAMSGKRASVKECNG